LKPHKIKELLSRPRSKVLLGNFFSLSILQIVNYLLPLVTIPYLTKIIGANLFGLLAIASAIIVYFQTFVDFGFDYSGARDIANNQTDVKAISKIFWTIIITKLILMIISLIILILMIVFIPFFKSHYIIILLTFLYIPGRVLFPEWFFQGMEKMKYITFLNVIAKLVFTILIFLVIKKRDDFIFQPLLTALGYTISGIASMYVIIFQFRIKMHIPSFLDIKYSLKKSYNIFLNLILPNLYNNVSTLLLGYWWGNAIVGIFDAGKKIISISEQAILVLSRTFFPYLAKNIQRHHIYLKISLFTGLFFGVIYLIGANIIVNILFTKEFEATKNIIRLMAISPILYALMNSFGSNYLILVNKEKVLRNITFVSSILGLIAALFLISHYKAVGAALTLILARGLMGGLSLVYSIKIKKLSIKNNTIIS
jgi:O-antigen/teichoic acid export membrane protein